MFILTGARTGSTGMKTYCRGQWSQTTFYGQKRMYGVHTQLNRKKQLACLLMDKH